MDKVEFLAYISSEKCLAIFSPHLGNIIAHFTMEHYCEFVMKVSVKTNSGRYAI